MRRRIFKGLIRGFRRLAGTDQWERPVLSPRPGPALRLETGAKFMSQ